MDSDAADRADSATSTSILPKACENCRVRKIRCNRQIPCSNCQTSGIQCRPATKTTEQRSRVLLSASYEKQIQEISNRLTGIEDAIKNLRLQGASPANLPDTVTSTNSDAARPQVTTPAAFEGASSFGSQALLAGQAAGPSLERIHGSAEVEDALTSLRKGFSGIRQDLHLGHTAPPRVLPDIQLLPSQFVLVLLQEFKNKISGMFLAYAFRDHKQLEKLCQRVYFPTEPVSLAGLTLMHGMLFYMIKELLFEGSHGAVKDYDLKGFAEQAERNFHLGLQTYEVLTHPSLESAKVLMLGMLKAQEEGKPLLTWTLSCTAARQVLSLGYHRRASLVKDSHELAEDKRQVFWTIYMVDKNLSLNLGYASIIQDYDIDAEYFKVSQDPGIAPWDAAALAMVDIARLQGLIYERLYSRQALDVSNQTKSQIVDDLALRLREWYGMWKHVNSGSAYLSNFWFLIYGAFDVTYYSLETTLFRGATHRAAMPSSNSIEITSACYEAAKKSLQAHLHFFPAFASYGDAEILSSYVAWILLYASWTPLIVVFLHAIASSSKEDVKLLEEVEESLEPLKHLNNQNYEQVYGLCKAFCKLASVFVERHSKFVGSYNSQEDTVVIPQQDHRNPSNNTMSTQQFTQFANTGNWPTPHDFQAASLDGSGMDDMSMFLGQWFGGNQPVSDLWNMDFTDSME